jgi:hypothetical protein
VVNFNTSASTGPDADQAVVQDMVNASVRLLTGKKTPPEAWLSLFPGLTLAKKIGIKLNIVNVKTPPHPYAVMALCAGLQQMEVNGKKFPAANIELWDGNNTNEYGWAGYTADRFPGLKINKYNTQSDHGDGADGNQPYADGLRFCDYLINVPGLRGHGAMVGQVTLGFKSHFGTYPASDSHPKVHTPVKAQEYLRDINCLGPVWQKTALVMNVGIFGLKQGVGPNGARASYLPYAKTMDPATENPAPNTIIMSTDPVTAEFQAIKPCV